MCIGAGLFNLGTIKVKSGPALRPKVGELGHAGLHPECHFILGDTRLGFRITKALPGFLVQSAQRVQHGTSITRIYARRVFHVKHGVAGAAERDAVVLCGQETTAPHSGEKGLGLAGLGKSGGKHHEGGKVFWRKGEVPMSNVFLSILHAMGIEQSSFSDSTGVLRDSIFSKV